MQETGIILFCDILGYRSFLTQNDTITEETEKVISILESASKESQQETLRLLPSIRPYDFLKQQRKARVFADTILITLPFDENDDELHKYIRWVYIITEAIVLHDHMLRNGLPIRGAISVGSYYLSETCFAGKPLAEAHDEAGEIQLSAVTITSSAYTRLLSDTKMGIDAKMQKWSEDMIHTYPTPCKSGVSDKRLLRIASAIINGIETDDSFALAAILKSFTGHKKLLDVTAETKAKNTLGYMRHFVQI